MTPTTHPVGSHPSDDRGAFEAPSCAFSFIKHQKRPNDPCFHCLTTCVHQYSHGSISSRFEAHWTTCLSKCFIIQFDRRILSPDLKDLHSFFWLKDPKRLGQRVKNNGQQCAVSSNHSCVKLDKELELQRNDQCLKGERRKGQRRPNETKGRAKEGRY